jgi:hypothetical protein
MNLITSRRRASYRHALPLGLLLGLLLAALPAGPPARAQAGALTLSVTPAFEGNYAPDRWLPLSIVLRNDGPTARVVVAAATPNARSRSTLPIELAGGAEARATLYAAMDRQARELRVSVEREGAVLAEQTVAVRPREGERMIGIISPQPLQLNLPLRQELAELPFLPFSFPPAALPDQPAGLSSLSLLLLSGAPAEGLRPAQLDALLAWVRSGGHLVLGGGGGAGTAIEALPPELRIVTPGATAQLAPAPLAEYSGAPAPAQIEGLTLSPAPGATVFGPPAAPLWAQRDVGLGRVTQLAFDPGLRALAEWPGAPALWGRLLRPVALYGSAFGSDPFPDLLREQTLANALGNLPAVNLPESNLLFALLALYAVLIGPGLALLLRRADRQSLGWVALPAAALLVFAVSGGLAYASRADQRLISQITLLEQVDADSARARSVVGLLSPQPETFALSLRPSALVRPIQPSASQYGPIEPVGGDISQGSGSLGLAVEPWTLQGVLAEEIVAYQALDAEIVLGPSGAEAVVRNTSGATLRDVAVAYAGQVVSMGTLGPGDEGRAIWPPAPAERSDAATPLSVLVLGEELAEARSAGGQIDRRLLIREALITAAVGRGGLGDEVGPLVLGWSQENPLEIAVTADGAASQQITLLVGRPRLSGSGPVAVPPGWMRLRPAEDGRPVCSSAAGIGLPASPQPLTMTLALPPDLAGLRAGDLNLDLESEREWPNAGVRTELYNWDEARWTETNFDGPGTLVVPQAGPFVSGGQLSVRLSGRIDEAGCIFPEVRLRGELP